MLKAQPLKRVPRASSREKAQLIGFLRSGAAAVVVLLLAALLTGALYQSVESFSDRRGLHAPGRLVAVDGYRMHLVCTGRGSPTVILEAGLGDSWTTWHKVQPAISGFTRVCSYDRAGMGFSDPRTGPPDSRRTAAHLHALLAAAGVALPYILVGHSVGGIHVRVFRMLYPREVVGVVLVDATPPDVEQRVGPDIAARLAPPSGLLTLASWTAPFGLPRLMHLCGASTPEMEAMQRTIECRRSYFQAVKADVSAMAAIAHDGRQAGALGATPLVVLSHDPNVGITGTVLPLRLRRVFETRWTLMQQELAGLSSQSNHVVASGSDHYVQEARPDLVIAGVRKVWNASKRLR